MLLNTLSLQITVKLYARSQIEFVKYTKQLFLNGYTSTCLVEDCYVAYVDVLKRDAFLRYSIGFFDNIGVMKSYLCTFCNCWQNKSCL